uniref:nSTAND3 domain-containing NTPase n=4 Tax=Flavobacterium sp. TaxID=239 RepID=UPI004048DC2B
MITAIEQALQRCNPDKFANVCRLYLAYRFPIVNATGFVVGKEKSKKGTPDNFIAEGDNFIFNEVTTIDKKALIAKLKKDVKHCFIQKDIPIASISKIILICNEEITTAIHKEISDYKKTFHNIASIELIGIDAFATIIFRDYPSIARELGLTIDSGQILEMSDFIIQYEKSKFATPLSNAFYNRKNDLKKGLELLKVSDYLLITGPAGIGKSKFSIELASKFNNANPEYIVKYIRNNNQLIWEDLKVQLVKDKKYLIVIDDANKLKSNLSTIIHFKNEFEDGSLKIILTVRNYVKSEVESELKNYEQIELNNFDKKELAIILQSPEFNITNYYTDRIFSISKGNPRIALMAAIEGIKDVQKLNKASYILEEYFSSANKSIKDDKTLLKVAGILSLFRSIDISNTNQIEEICSRFDILTHTLIEKLSALVEHELADEFQSTYKVADQILGEYIFYLVFIKNKDIPFMLLLDLYYDEHKISLTRLLNPIVSNYGFNEVKQLIIKDINTKWNSLKHDREKAIRFLDSFWFYLQTETLLFVNEIINSLESINENDLKFEIYKDNHIKSYDDKIISLLVNFHNVPDKFELALELLIKYGLSAPIVFTKVLKAFQQSFIYERFSYEQQYSSQIQLFNFLYSKAETNPILYSKIILYIADKFLIDSYQYNEGGDGRTIYFGQMIVVLTKEQKEFRTKLLNFIFCCYQDEILKDEVYNFFERHHYSHGHEKEKRVLTFDKNLIISFFISKFTIDSFREANIVKKYLRTYGWAKIRYRKEAKKLLKNKDFVFWSSLDKRYDREMPYLEDYRSFTFENYNDLLSSLERISKYSDGNNSCLDSIIGPVSEIILDLGQRDFNLFIKVLFELMKYDFAGRLYFGRIISNLTYDNDKISLLKSVFRTSQNESYYLMEMFTRVPKEFLIIADYNQLLKVVAEPDNKNVWILDHMIRRMPEMDMDAAIEIPKVLGVIISKIGKVDYINLHCDFFKVIHENYSEVFADNLTILEKIYLYFDDQGRHFDYDLNVLKIILSYNANFITNLLKYSLDEKDYLSRRDFNDNDFKKLWDLDNNVLIFDNMINYLVNFKSIFVHGASEFSKAFRGNNHEEIEFLQNKIITTQDNKMIELVFNIVTTIYRDKMLDFLKIILEKGCDIELFKRLDFYTSAGVTMGSRLPNMQFELTQYEKVLKFLNDQKDIKYLEFIELLEKNIMYAKMSIERERKEEFVSEWD